MADCLWKPPSQCGKTKTGRKVLETPADPPNQTRTLEVRDMADSQHICSVDDCGKPVKARGYCPLHYSRFRIHRDPGPAKLRQNQSNLNWLKKAILAETDECIPWPFWRSAAGYGMIRYDGATRPASRVALLLSNGEPPDTSYQACHQPLICNNPACINPRHLRWGTPLENSIDSRIDGTMRIGEDHYRSVLTDDDVRAIRAGGHSDGWFARRLGVSKTQIRRVRIGAQWKHVDSTFQSIGDLAAELVRRAGAQ